LRQKARRDGPAGFPNGSVVVDQIHIRGAVVFAVLIHGSQRHIHNTGLGIAVAVGAVSVHEGVRKLQPGLTPIIGVNTHDGGIVTAAGVVEVPLGELDTGNNGRALSQRVTDGLLVGRHAVEGVMAVGLTKILIDRVGGLIHNTAGRAIQGGVCHIQRSIVVPQHRLRCSSGTGIVGSLELGLHIQVNTAGGVVALGHITAVNVVQSAVILQLYDIPAVAVLIGISTHGVQDRTGLHLPGSAGIVGSVSQGGVLRDPDQVGCGLAAGGGQLSLQHIVHAAVQLHLIPETVEVLHRAGDGDQGAFLQRCVHRGIALGCGTQLHIGGLGHFVACGVVHHSGMCAGSGSACTGLAGSGGLGRLIGAAGIAAGSLGGVDQLACLQQLQHFGVLRCRAGVAADTVGSSDLCAVAVAAVRANAVKRCDDTAGRSGILLKISGTVLTGVLGAALVCSLLHGIDQLTGLQQLQHLRILRSGSRVAADTVCGSDLAAVAVAAVRANAVERGDDTAGVTGVPRKVNIAGCKSTYTQSDQRSHDQDHGHQGSCQTSILHRKFLQNIFPRVEDRSPLGDGMSLPFFPCFFDHTFRLVRPSIFRLSHEKARYFAKSPNTVHAINFLLF